MKLAIVHSNILLVDDTYLDFRESESREKLQAALEHKPLFHDAIQAMYFEQVKLHPDHNVQRGSIWLGVLATQKTLKITYTGYDKRYRSQINRGVLDEKEYIDSQYHGIWDIVQKQGFRPEIRMSKSTPHPCGSRQVYIKNTADLLLKDI